jgi:hypothetical protein
MCLSSQAPLPPPIRWFTLRVGLRRELWRARHPQ